MSNPSAPSTVSRRSFLGLCAGGLAAGGLAGGADRALAQPAAPPVFPMVGNIQVTSVEILVNGARWPKQQPAFNVSIEPNGSFHGTPACALELSSGIAIEAKVTMVVGAGPTPRDFGRLAFLQLTRYSRTRSPSGLNFGSPNKACSTSANLWRLDSQYPYHRRYFPCQAGINQALLQDGPNVLTEDVAAYDTVTVDPMDSFQSWLIWEATDNGKRVSPSNVLKPHVLGRVDWFWKGVSVQGAKGSTCSSPKLFPGTTWMLQAEGAQVTDVALGLAAGAPAMLNTPNRIPRATPQAWLPC